MKDNIVAVLVLVMMVVVVGVGLGIGHYQLAKDLKRYEQVQLTVVSEPEHISANRSGDWMAEVESPDGLSAKTAVPVQAQLGDTVPGWVDTHTTSIWRSDRTGDVPVTNPSHWVLLAAFPEFGSKGSFWWISQPSL